MWLTVFKALAKQPRCINQLTKQKPSPLSNDRTVSVKRSCTLKKYKLVYFRYFCFTIASLPLFKIEKKKYNKSRNIVKFFQALSLKS